MDVLDLISPEYLETQRALHASPRGYGGKGDKWALGVLALARQYGATSVLDYGCGQGRLGAALCLHGLTIQEYDPAIAGKHALPRPADVVVCTDVLEHIEPDKLQEVLAHLKDLARKVLFVVIATRPANKTLPDGRNAHLTIQDAAWWETIVRRAGFTVHPGPTSPSLKPSREWVAVLTS